jgi:AcrR family transcriptional regulator
MVVERSNREQKADETRRRIFAAAAELFAERGFHETTVAQIVLKAGVAKGTFFIHFATKDGVVGELVRVQTQKAERARRRLLEAGGTPLEALRTTVLTIAEQAGASRELSRAVLAAALESREVGGAAAARFSEVFRLMVGDARAAVAAGLLDRTVEPELVARALMASYLGAAFEFCSEPGAPPLAELLGPLVDWNLAAFSRGAALNQEASDAPIRKARRTRPRR